MHAFMQFRGEMCRDPASFAPLQLYGHGLPSRLGSTHAPLYAPYAAAGPSARHTWRPSVPRRAESPLVISHRRPVLHDEMRDDPEELVVLISKIVVASVAMHRLAMRSDGYLRTEHLDLVASRRTFEEELRCGVATAFMAVGLPQRGATRPTHPSPTLRRTRDRRACRPMQPRTAESPRLNVKTGLPT